MEIVKPHNISHACSYCEVKRNWYAKLDVVIHGEQTEVYLCEHCISDLDCLAMDYVNDEVL